MINGDEGDMLFLDAPGGTGKTFIYRFISLSLMSDRSGLNIKRKLMPLRFT